MYFFEKSVWETNNFFFWPLESASSRQFVLWIHFRECTPNQTNSLPFQKEMTLAERAFLLMFVNPSFLKASNS